MKRTLIFVPIALLFLFLTACSLGTSRPINLDSPTQNVPTEELIFSSPTAPTIPDLFSAVEETPQPTPPIAPVPTERFADGINPLTGLTVSDPALLARRPVSVKINNYPRSSRPQWGLSLADLVFEFYHNNDLPRFHAIFYGNNAAQVGPIRSGRLFDDYLLQMYGSDFVFGSADERILNQLKAGDYAERLVYLLNGKCPANPVCRFDPQGYNYLVADTAAVNQFVLARGVPDTVPDLRGMTFDPAVPAGGVPVSEAYLRYSYGAYLYWDFNPNQGNYSRMQDTQEDFQGRGEAYAPLTDRLTGATITAQNVVFLIVRHFHEVYIPAEGTTPKVEIVNMDFEEDGKAFALRDGMLFELYWVRPPHGGVLTFVYSDGSPYPFKPGNTWFQVISEETRRTLKDGVLRYEFHFSPPSQ